MNYGKRMVLISIIVVCSFIGCSDNVEYSFSEELPAIGTYELVQFYDDAGGVWYTESDNISDYAWSQCLNVWNSYIAIYEASHEIKWLEKLSEQIDDVLERRDSISGKLDRNGYSLPSWSFSTLPDAYKPYHNPVIIGIIIYPILRYVEIVKTDSIERYSEKADEYLLAALDALSVIDMDVNKYNNCRIPEDACENLWREDSNNGYGYYVGHLYYEEPYFKSQGYVTDNPLPYNQSLSISQCYPVLYRILGDDLWKIKTEESWNWFEANIQKDDIWWWYYSEYYNWNRQNCIPIKDVDITSGENYYEDYEGHYSLDLMFIIEAHKIGVVDDTSLYEIGRNKKEMGLSESGWPLIMKCEPSEKNNLKAAVYFDYFVVHLNDFDYLNRVFTVLEDEIKYQYDNNLLADKSTKNNGTCLRLLISAYIAEKAIDNN